MNSGSSLHRFSDSGENLEQCTLTSAVRTDQANHLSFVHLEGNIFERPYGFLGLTHSFTASNQTAYLVCQQITQGIVASLDCADLVSLREALHADCNMAHRLHQIAHETDAHNEMIN